MSRLTLAVNVLYLDLNSWLLFIKNLITNMPSKLFIFSQKLNYKYAK